MPMKNIYKFLNTKYTLERNLISPARLLLAIHKIFSFETLRANEPVFQFSLTFLRKWPQVR
jgi:hypothetical protein